MLGDSPDGRPAPREFGKRTLKTGRLLHMFRESGVEDPWSNVALAVCAFEELHTKDGWEYLLTNRRDIEDIAGVYAKAASPEEFREKLSRLKGRGR